MNFTPSFTVQCSGVSKEGVRCTEVFASAEPLSPNARYICKNHPRTEQVRAAGRVCDERKDHADGEACFQGGQFDRVLRKAHGPRFEETKAFRVRSGRSTVKQDKEIMVEVYRLQAVMSDEQLLKEANSIETLLSVLTALRLQGAKWCDDPKVKKFESRLLRDFKTLAGQPSTPVTPVEDSAYRLAERAAWGRPFLFPRDQRTVYGCLPDYDTKPLTADQGYDCSFLGQVQKLLRGGKSRTKRSKKSTYKAKPIKITPELIEALRSQSDIPEFVVEGDEKIRPRLLHGSGHLWSHELLKGAKHSTPRRALLLTFGKSDQNLDAYDHLIPKEETPTEKFETVNSSTQGDPTRDLRDLIAATKIRIERGKVKGSLDDRRDHPEKQHSVISKEGRIVTFHENDPAFREAALKAEQILGKMTDKEVGETMKNTKTNRQSTTGDAVRMRHNRLTKSIATASRTASELFMSAIGDEYAEKLWNRGGIFVLVRRRNGPQVYRLPDAEITRDGEPVFDSEIVLAGIDLFLTKLSVDRAQKAGRKAAEGIISVADRKAVYAEAFCETIEAFKNAEWYVLAPLKSSLPAPGPREGLIDGLADATR